MRASLARNGARATSSSRSVSGLPHSRHCTALIRPSIQPKAPSHASLIAASPYLNFGCISPTIII
jgi:hypothetical protein